jgi:hypothetical protein
MTVQRINLIAVIMKNPSSSDEDKRALLGELQVPDEVIEFIFHLTKSLLNP